MGDTAEIRRLARRRQKNDQRDADLLLELLIRCFIMGRAEIDYVEFLRRGQKAETE
ncbi:MAG TPA: hypothetical protein VGQ39_12870 [Pyrinomonadaceae bacterium]|nr:hypothetical protein [Pyrinomonadaceae bacterium]